MGLNIDYRKVMKDVVRIVTTRIMLQVPVDTGYLKSTVKVSAVDKKVEIDYTGYGAYTNYGTGKYYQSSKFKYGTEITPGYFKGYKRGTGGIRSQYWTSISLSDRDGINILIQNEIELQTIKYLEGEFDEDRF